MTVVKSKNLENELKPGYRVVATRINEKLYSMLLDYVSKSPFTSLSELFRFMILYFMSHNAELKNLEEMWKKT